MNRQRQSCHFVTFHCHGRIAWTISSVVWRWRRWWDRWLAVAAAPTSLSLLYHGLALGATSLIPSACMELWTWRQLLFPKQLGCLPVFRKEIFQSWVQMYIDLSGYLCWYFFWYFWYLLLFVFVNLVSIVSLCVYLCGCKCCIILSYCSEEIVYLVAEAIGTEARAINIDASSRGEYGLCTGMSCFSPFMNLVRHPLWGRVQVRFCFCRLQFTRWILFVPFANIS